MKDIIGIYKITNKINGKSYIGQSKYLERRWKDHRSKYPYETEKALYQAMNKYGLENFEFEVVQKCQIDELDKLEQYYIEKFDSYKNGYNRTFGGQTFKETGKLTQADVDEIIVLLRDSLYILKEIAEMYDVIPDTIALINRGKIHKREIEYPIRTFQANVGDDGVRWKTTFNCLNCGKKISQGRHTLCGSCAARERHEPRPEKEDLINMIFKKGMSGASENFNVTGGTITNWLKEFKEPTSLEGLIQKYGDLREYSQKRINYSTIFLEGNGFKKEFNSTADAANWIIDNNFTSASFASVRGSVGRVIRGSRKTYLGFTIKGIK